MSTKLELLYCELIIWRKSRKLKKNVLTLLALWLNLAAMTSHGISDAECRAAGGTSDHGVSGITNPSNLKSVTTLKDFPVRATSPIGLNLSEDDLQPAGVLSGKVIYLGAGHGWTAGSNGAWNTQRGENGTGMIEDLGNIDQLTIFVDYLYQAGATIVPFRPVGNQLNEVVLDNDDPEVEFIPENAWGFGSNIDYFGGANDAERFRFALSNSEITAVARYTPKLPEAGYYPIYVWSRSGGDSLPDQEYRVLHTGGATVVKVNHLYVGDGWVYIGNFYFNEGTEGSVEVLNRTSSTEGGVAVADAIRFGNGMGDIDRGAGISGEPREDEASRYWIQRALGINAPTSIYDQSSLNDQSDNVSAPTRMTAWMNDEFYGSETDRIYLGFHSNAFDPGSLGLYNGNNFSGAATQNQEEWAFIIANELNTDLVDIGSPPFESPWPDRVAQGLSLTLDRTDIEFGEIRGDRLNYEMDATIIEVAAHGNLNEAQLMRDLKVRRAVARASLQAIIRYFHEYGGDPLVFPPDTPGEVSATLNADDTVSLEWKEPEANSIVGDQATGYDIYSSSDGRGYTIFKSIDDQVTSTTLTDVPLGDTVYYKIAARNAGGSSIPSEPVCVYNTIADSSRLLIVNGFDRIDRFMSFKQTVFGNTIVDRVKAHLINSQDYVVEHAEALAPHGREFSSCSNEAVINGDVDLFDYDAVFWILGEESTTDETFSDLEISLLEPYLDAGNRIFVSGSEVAWDLDNLVGDPAFYNNYLSSDYIADLSNSYLVNGETGSIFEGLTFDFSPGSDQYDAEFADVIQPGTGGSICARYTTGGGAAIQGATGSPERRVVTLGFPFELIRGDSTRIEAMRRVLEYFEIPRASDSWMLR